MRLFQKLVLFMLAAVVVPLAVVGFSLLRSAERELQARIGAQQATMADAVAQMASRDVDEAVESLTLTARQIPWSEVTPDERSGGLRLLLRQSKRFTAAVLLDGQGREILPVATLEESEARPGAALRPDELAAFRAAIPVADLAKAEVGEVFMSPAYARPRQGAAAAAVGVVVPGPAAKWLLAVEVSLASLEDRAVDLSRRGAGELVVLDREGRLLAAPDPAALLTKASPKDLEVALAASRAGSFDRYARIALEGHPVLAAAARTPDALGWTALIRLPEAEAFRPVRRMRTTVLASMGAALALLFGLGFVFSRGVGRAVERVAQGARAWGRGDLAARIPVESKDELGELAATFNAMGGELAAARARLERWNEDLKREVDERTRELKDAQAQLLETQKLAAIGQLGAGVAHEINNPLAGILGHAQLMLLDRPGDDREAAALRKIEALAKRAKEITAALLRFSQLQQRPAGSFYPLDLNKVVAETVALVQSQMRSEGVELVLSLAPEPVQAKGDAGPLSQVLLNLIANARTAMAKSAAKRLTVSTRHLDDRVVLEVADTGKGVAGKNLERIFEPFFTTKDVWSNVGLGLSVSYRIVTDHGGKIRVASEEGKGATFTVELPAPKPARS